MEKVTHKGRERLKRGVIKSFDELPQETQNNFKQIKKIVSEFLGVETDMYVFGSYKHGYWDELSDYDYIINVPFNRKNVDLHVLSVSGIKSNAIQTHLKLSDILIP